MWRSLPSFHWNHSTWISLWNSGNFSVFFRLKNIVWYHQKPFTKNNSNWCLFWSGPPVCKYDLGIHSIEKKSERHRFSMEYFFGEIWHKYTVPNDSNKWWKQHRTKIEILSCHGEGNSGKPIRFIAIPAYPGTTSLSHWYVHSSYQILSKNRAVSLFIQRLISKH